MNFKTTLNKFLNGKFGENYYFHWQNLNELPGSSWNNIVVGKPWHGRCFLHLNNRTINLEWNLKSKSCAAKIAAGPDCEQELKLNLALPPISLWLTLSGFMPYETLKKIFPDNESREVGFSIYDWSI